MNLITCDKETQLKSKVIFVTPAYRILNKTEFTLNITQFRFSQKKFLLKPGEEGSYTWPNAGLLKYINISIYKEKFKKSGCLDPNLQGIHPFFIKPDRVKDKNMFKYFLLKIYQEKSFNYLIIEEDP